NVLVYMFDRAAPGKRERARQLFAEHAASNSVLISTQVLQEFFVAVTRKLSAPLGAPEALEALEQFRSFSPLTVDSTLIVRAAARSGREMLSFWDALIVETASSGGATCLLTEDMQHGQRFGGLVVENPFREVH